MDQNLDFTPTGSKDRFNAANKCVCIMHLNIIPVAKCYRQQGYYI